MTIVTGDTRISLPLPVSFDVSVLTCVTSNLFTHGSESSQLHFLSMDFFASRNMNMRIPFTLLTLEVGIRLSATLSVRFERETSWWCGGWPAAVAQTSSSLWT